MTWHGQSGKTLLEISKVCVIDIFLGQTVLADLIPIIILKIQFLSNIFESKIIAVRHWWHAAFH